MSEAIKFAMSDLGGLFANVVTGRRDAVLATSTQPEEARRWLRAVPLQPSSLFGDSAAIIVHQSADRHCDRAVMAAASRPSGRQSYRPQNRRSAYPPPPSSRSRSGRWETALRSRSFSRGGLWGRPQVCHLLQPPPSRTREE